MCKDKQEKISEYSEMVNMFISNDAKFLSEISRYIEIFQILL